MKPAVPKNLPRSLVALLTAVDSRPEISCPEVAAIDKVVSRAMGAEVPRAGINRSFSQLKRNNPNFYTNVVAWTEKPEVKALASASGTFWAALEWHAAFSKMEQGIKPSVAFQINGRPPVLGLRDAEHAGLYAIYLHRHHSLRVTNADMIAARDFGVAESAARVERLRFSKLDTPTIDEMVDHILSANSMPHP